MKIQVLERGFKLMEIAAENPEAVLSISELAAASGLKNTTCFHIVNTLTAMGYLECLGKRRGYRLGPAVSRFSRYPVYRRKLAEAAEPRLRRFAAELGETILLSVCRNGCRYILAQAEGQNTLQVNPSLILQDMYCTATGRLLLAWAGDGELAAAIALLGLPGRVWNGIDTPEKLRVELEAVRRENPLIQYNNPEVAQIAVPVWENGEMIAALGCFVPHYRFQDAHREKVLSELQNIAAAIGRA